MTNRILWKLDLPNLDFNPDIDQLDSFLSLGDYYKRKKVSELLPLMVDSASLKALLEDYITYSHASIPYASISCVEQYGFSWNSEDVDISLEEDEFDRIRGSALASFDLEPFFDRITRSKDSLKITDDIVFTQTELDEIVNLTSGMDLDAFIKFFVKDDIKNVLEKLHNLYSAAVTPLRAAIFILRSIGSSFRDLESSEVKNLINLMEFANRTVCERLEQGKKKTTERFYLNSETINLLREGDKICFTPPFSPPKGKKFTGFFEGKVDAIRMIINDSKESVTVPCASFAEKYTPYVHCELIPFEKLKRGMDCIFDVEDETGNKRTFRGIFLRKDVEKLFFVGIDGGEFDFPITNFGEESNIKLVKSDADSINPWAESSKDSEDEEDGISESQISFGPVSEDTGTEDTGTEDPGTNGEILNEPDDSDELEEYALLSELLNLEELFISYGMDKYPYDRQKKIKIKIYDIFKKRVSLRIMSMMSEEQKKKVKALEIDHLCDFIEKEGIDFDEAMIAEAAGFGEELKKYLKNLSEFRLKNSESL